MPEVTMDIAQNVLDALSRANLRVDDLPDMGLELLEGEQFSQTMDVELEIPEHTLLFLEKHHIAVQEVVRRGVIDLRGEIPNEETKAALRSNPANDQPVTDSKELLSTVGPAT
jgi:hypothetical protein